MEHFSPEKLAGRALTRYSEYTRNSAQLSIRSPTSKCSTDFDFKPKPTKFVLKTKGILLSIHRKRNRFKWSYDERVITVLVRPCHRIRVCTILPIKAPTLYPWLLNPSKLSCKMKYRFRID
ncbi:hypothetical protein QL285_053272 [Trifolium repens]|nr:hypothetical protein QL285_053270 [Trifolium repens]KAK2403874.1 hypothetical protein QL285_053271 [Trifolium repens]KAK2403875.1 hypothetical protein QL285_053272 [Trifolium repens]